MTTLPDKPPSKKPSANSTNGKYATMTEAERLVWHTNVHAFRRVYLGVPDSEHTSPPDPEGKYFNQALVDAEVARLRPQKEEKERSRSVFTFTDEELSERALWAAGRGYRHWNDFLDAVQAGRESIKPFVFWYIERHPPKYPLRVGSFFRFTPQAAE